MELNMKWSNCFEENNSLSHGQSCFERFRLQTYSILVEYFQSKLS